MPATVPQAGTRFGLQESVRRGGAEPGWAEMANKILLPAADYQGAKVLTVGLGATSVENAGAATGLIPLWRHQIIGKDCQHYNPRLQAESTRARSVRCERNVTK